MRLSTSILVVVLLLYATGCAYVKRGSLDVVSPTSGQERVGKVYLVRGWIGIFSTGMDSLGEKIRKDGIEAEVYQGEQTNELAEAIIRSYSASDEREPLVLIGHSYGADNVLRIARRLEAANIPVDLLVTFDPVTPPQVPGNIRRLENYFKPNGAWDNLPWLRGIPLKVEEAKPVTLVNVDLLKDRPDLLEANTNHFNIEKNDKLHREVLLRLKTVCPPREVWAAQRQAERYTQAPASSMEPVHLSSVSGE